MTPVSGPSGSSTSEMPEPAETPARTVHSEQAVDGISTGD